MTSRGLLLSGVLAGVLVASFGSMAFAKGDDLPLNVRMVGLGGERGIQFVSGGDLNGAAAFSDQVADIEQVATSLVFGSGRPASLPTPGLTDFYEIDFTQPLAADRFPWNGMPSPQFYYYPAHGSLPAYVRLHMARGSQPAVDGWLLARPGFIDLINRHLNGLAPLHPQPTPPNYPVGWWLLGPVLLFVVASLLLLRRLLPRYLFTRRRVPSERRQVPHA
ncbi:MAG: hypothetical protein M3256_04525 [Actinomycetota bacterium]|nr:hypothetical protein [Actinomycetota bacterium]